MAIGILISGDGNKVIDCSVKAQNPIVVTGKNNEINTVEIVEISAPQHAANSVTKDVHSQPLRAQPQGKSMGLLSNSTSFLALANGGLGVLKKAKDIFF